MKKVRLWAAIGIFCLFFISGGTGEAQYRNGIPVLLYHHVTDDFSDMPELTLSPEEFARQLALLKSAGFQTISLQQFMAYMNKEKVDLPEKPILITFDDGYLDNYTYAFPLLKKQGFTAAVFMVGINVDRKNRLSRDNMEKMSRAGFDFGAHSMTHPNLMAITPKQLEREVTASKEKISQALSDRKAEFFAYPGGHYNFTVMAAVEGAGYQGAFTVLTGLNNPEHDWPYLLRRIPIFRFTDFDKLLILLNENHPKTGLLDYDV